MTALLEMPTTPPTATRTPMDTHDSEIRNNKMDDHDLLIEMRTEQRTMLREIRELKTNFTDRLANVEKTLAETKTDHSTFKARVYGGWFVLTVLFSLATLYVAWHK